MEQFYFSPAGTPALDVPYVPTPQPVVDAMLRLGGVKRGDFLIDLGSGDGRIVISAARDHGARGIGVDLNPERIQEANANAKAAGVTYTTPGARISRTMPTTVNCRVLLWILRVIRLPSLASGNAVDTS